jgi:hypothetical protein
LLLALSWALTLGLPTLRIKTIHHLIVVALKILRKLTEIFWAKSRSII